MAPSGIRMRFNTLTCASSGLTRYQTRSWSPLAPLMTWRFNR